MLSLLQGFICGLELGCFKGSYPCLLRLVVKGVLFVGTLFGTIFLSSFKSFVKGNYRNPIGHRSACFRVSILFKVFFAGAYPCLKGKNSRKMES